MSRGGRRINSGRKKGSRTNASLAMARKLKKEGLSPLDLYIAIFRDEDAPIALRLSAAKAADRHFYPEPNNMNNDPNKNSDISHSEVLRRIEVEVRQEERQRNSERLSISTNSPTAT